MSVLDDASLVLIPSGYKASKLYSVVPTSGDGDLSFSRSTTATRVNADGLIETVAINTPRIDFTGGGCGKLLLEPQRTNNIEYSQDFENSYWTKSGSSITANNTTSPDGTTNADKLSEDSANSRHSVFKTIQSISGRQYSVFAKANGRDWILLTSHSVSASDSRGQFFNVSNGTVGTGGDSTTNAKIEDYGNGWYKCTIGEGSSPSSIYTVMTVESDGGSVIYQGDGSSGVYLWQADNQEDYMTSPIPTAGSTVTRTQDLSVTTGLSDQIGSDEGLFLLDAQAFLNGGDGNRQIAISDGTNDNHIYINFHNSANRIETLAVKAGSVLAAKSAFSVNQSNRNIIAIRYKTDNYDVWTNGSSIGILTGMGAFFTANQLNKLQFNSVLGTSHMKAKVNKVILSKTYPTDTEMAALTTI